MNKKINKQLEWDEKSVRMLPLNALMVLNIFINSKKDFMDSSEIQKALKLKGKRFGAIMAIFSKYSREALLISVLRVNRGETRWAINQKYYPLIQKVILEMRQYLK